MVSGVLVVVQSRSRGSRLNIIIVAEGAIDREGQHISSEFVKDVSTAQSLTDAEGEPEAGPTGGHRCVRNCFSINLIWTPATLWGMSSADMA